MLSYGVINQPGPAACMTLVTLACFVLVLHARWTRLTMTAGMALLLVIAGPIYGRPAQAESTDASKNVFILW